MSLKLLKFIGAGILLVIFIIMVVRDSKHPHLSSAQPLATSQVAGTAGSLGARTKTTGCIVNGALPDTACTPGAIISSATQDMICRSGYAKSVRNVPSAVKTEVYREYGITTHAPGEYEVDHLVSLELGGSNDIANLWPEAADPTPGFHEKDAVENYLHDQVCSGKMSLDAAQHAVAANWLTVYKTVQ